jgi:hypothetical protein
MASITGRIHELGSPIKAWKNFRLSIEKNIQSLVDEFAKHGQEMMESWEVQVKNALGVQLPKKYWHRRRPNPGKLFPYKNTGDQQESVKGAIRNKVTAAGNFSITVWGEIGVPYASYTNKGKPARSSGGQVAWTGWVDDILYNNGRGGIMSVSDVFELISVERSVLKGFEA